ncbi:alpha-lytic protease prodomain-containing protein [Kribbella sp. VKM Ac-2527]|uniref:Alpha-lytic protease prodomain-containing protein n=1 Tax=Kribbella caucasensis TaxID=2512215 RepID=A0A4R6KMG8_9ACTN|nr:S1 family peptidase [Kribbella sp. VKM Ac-2527]TDO52784.1 alpha-lytic protease prodomain-containing protein [Kribbella sp. VKM Ac-2527]
MKVLLATAVVAAMLTVPGQAVAATTPEQPPAGSELAVPRQAAAMQNDLGLTERQMKERLTAESAATKLVPTAQRAAGSAFGGVWYDAARQKLIVGVTNPKAAAAVRATGAEASVVPASTKQLDQRKAAVDKLAGKAVPDAVSGWSADPMSGSVVVNVQAGKRSAAVDAFVNKVSKAGAVTVREVAAQAPRTFAAGTVGGDPYYVSNIRCSIGFSVHGGFVTAGHCGRSGTVRGWDGSDMGSFRGWSFPGNDYAWVSVGNGWWTVPVVLGWGQVSDHLVRGSWEAPVGTSVCRSGSTTHWHCGHILAKNETVNYGNGQLFYGATKTSVCAEGGDSGGSFITGDQAQGVTSGGWGNCSSGGETWFQPVNEILSAYGLTLHTA